MSMMVGGSESELSWPSLFRYALVFAPLVTFASYIWIARRPWSVRTLVAWGFVSHLPFLWAFFRAREDLGAFKVSVALVLAMLVHVYYVWSIRQQTARAGARVDLGNPG
jgi:hypothetical protein